MYLSPFHREVLAPARARVFFHANTSFLRARFNDLPGGAGESVFEFRGMGEMGLLVFARERMMMAYYGTMRAVIIYVGMSDEGRGGISGRWGIFGVCVCKKRRCSEVAKMAKFFCIVYIYLNFTYIFQSL